MSNIGIYCIKCLKNNKIYVGSAINIKYRFTRHKNDLLNKKHHSKHLQRAWDLYGENEFSFEILESNLDNNLLIERENYWISFFRSSERRYGFNILNNARTRLGIKHSKKTKNKISKNSFSKGKFYENSIHGSKEVYQYDFDGNFIKKWNSLKEPANILSITHQNISKCVLGQRFSAGGFLWFSDNRGSKISNYRIYKEVIQLTKNEKIIKEFKNITEILKLYPNFTVQCIWAVCNNKRKTAYGYKWKYKNDYEKTKQFEGFNIVRDTSIR
jgi:hypothetical protein